MSHVYIFPASRNVLPVISAGALINHNYKVDVKRNDFPLECETEWRFDCVLMSVLLEVAVSQMKVIRLSWILSNAS